MSPERSPLEQSLYEVVYTATRDALRDHRPPDPRQVREPRTSGLRRLDVAEVAAIARCRPETVRKALEAGELSGWQRVKGGRWLVKPEELDRWLGGTGEHAGNHR